MDRREALFRTLDADPYLLYDAIVSSTDNYIYIVDMKRDMALVTENMVRDFELPGLMVPGLVPLWGGLIHERDQERYFQSIQDMMDGKTDEHNVEYQIRNRKGEYIWIICRGKLKRDGAGTPIVFAGVVTSLGDKGKVDHTTGLFTQQECEKRVDWLMCQREGKALGGILLLGLDDFGRVNDLNDHIFGDVVLRQFAQAVQTNLPDGAEAFRFDGDEVAVLCPGGTRKDLLELYRRVHAYCNCRHSVDGVSYFCTVSGGVAMLGADSDNYLDIIKYVGSALDASKRNGKNCCTVFSFELLQARRRAQELVDRLQLSVSRGMEGFHLVFQPIVRAEDEKVLGAETLLRWSCEDFGIVTPDEFVPLLEQSGLIVPVGNWVLDGALRVCKEWVERCPEFVMNVNISYLQMVNRNFLPLVEALLEKYQLDPFHVMLELTEGYFVTDMETLQNTVQTLRAKGFRIAVDDFGTGYSSLGRLAQLPADEVKIDRSFIADIALNGFNRSFIGAVIQLCHGVGISVCVEGVENSNELHVVLMLGADNIQGFYFSRPVTEEDFRTRYWEDAPCNR